MSNEQEAVTVETYFQERIYFLHSLALFVRQMMLTVKKVYPFSRNWLRSALNTIRATLKLQDARDIWTEIEWHNAQAFDRKITCLQS